MNVAILPVPHDVGQNLLRSLAVFATWTNACQAARQERLLGGACGGVVVLLDTLIRLNVHNNREAGPFLWEPRTCML